MYTANTYATADGLIESEDTTYSLAANGTGATITATEAEPNTYGHCGQSLNGGLYSCRETFLRFDLSSIPAQATILAADFSVYVGSDLTTQDFIANLYNNAWSSPITTGEWVTPSVMSAMTPVATLDTTGMGTGRKTFTSGAGMLPLIQGGGTVEFLLASSRLVAQTPATATNERFVYWTQNVSGVSLDPKLAITYMLPVPMENF